MQPLNPELASAYLDSLRLIPYLNDTVIKENQTLIIDELTHKTNNNLLDPILVNEPQFAATAKAVHDFQKEIESNSADVSVSVSYGI